MQATDADMATRNARVVLVDDEGMRAVMTASWLGQMGWNEVQVLAGGLAGRPLDRAEVAPISPAELAQLLDRGETTVIDLATSLFYEAGHIPGARLQCAPALRRASRAWCGAVFSS